MDVLRHAGIFRKQSGGGSKVTGRPQLAGNVGWSFAGNAVYAGCQWGMLIVLAKRGTPEMVGQFALATAITSPVILLANLQLRAVEATDVGHEFRFGDYLGLRIVCITAAVLLLAATAICAGYSRESTLMILAMGLAKAMESFSDLVYGLLQRQERMNWIAFSMMGRGAISLAALFACIETTGSLLWGTTAMAACGALTLAIFDVPAGSATLRATAGGRGARERLRPAWEPGRLWKLARVTFPLGFVMMLMALSRNFPRYLIERHLGQRELGIFSALAYLQVAGTTVVDALGQSSSPRLARHFASGDRLRFRGLLGRLSLLAVLLGIAGVAAAWLGGRQILTLIYRAEYATQAGIFLWLMVLAGVGYVGSVLGYGITATRCFALFPAPYLALAIAAGVCSCLAIPAYGLRGACVSVGVVQFGSCLVPGWILRQLQNGSSHVTSPPAID